MCLDEGVLELWQHCRPVCAALLRGDLRSRGSHDHAHDAHPAYRRSLLGLAAIRVVLVLNLGATLRTEQRDGPQVVIDALSYGRDAFSTRQHADLPDCVMGQGGDRPLSAALGTASDDLVLTRDDSDEGAKLRVSLVHFATEQ